MLGVSFDSLRKETLKNPLLFKPVVGSTHTGARVQICDLKTCLQKFNGRNETVALNPVLVKVVRVSTDVSSMSISANMSRRTTATHFDVKTIITPQSINCSNRRRSIIASTISVTY